MNTKDNVPTFENPYFASSKKKVTTTFQNYSGQPEGIRTGDVTQQRVTNVTTTFNRNFEQGPSINQGTTNQVYTNYLPGINSSNTREVRTGNFNPSAYFQAGNALNLGGATNYFRGGEVNELDSSYNRGTTKEQFTRIATGGAQAQGQIQGQNRVIRSQYTINQGQNPGIKGYTQFDTIGSGRRQAQQQNIVIRNEASAQQPNLERDVTKTERVYQQETDRPQYNKIYEGSKNSNSKSARVKRSQDDKCSPFLCVPLVLLGIAGIVLGTLFGLGIIGGTGARGAGQGETGIQQIIDGVPYSNNTITIQTTVIDTTNATAGTNDTFGPSANASAFDAKGAPGDPVSFKNITSVYTPQDWSNTTAPTATVNSTFDPKGAPGDPVSFKNITTVYNPTSWTPSAFDNVTGFDPKGEPGQPVVFAPGTNTSTTANTTTNTSAQNQGSTTPTTVVNPSTNPSTSTLDTKGTIQVQNVTTTITPTTTNTTTNTTTTDGTTNPTSTNNQSTTNIIPTTTVTPSTSNTAGTTQAPSPAVNSTSGTIQIENVTTTYTSNATNTTTDNPATSGGSETVNPLPAAPTGTANTPTTSNTNTATNTPTNTTTQPSLISPNSTIITTIQTIQSLDNTTNATTNTTTNTTINTTSIQPISVRPTFVAPNTSFALPPATISPIVVQPIVVPAINTTTTTTTNTTTDGTETPLTIDQKNSILEKIQTWDHQKQIDLI